MAMEARSRRGLDGERGAHTGHTRGPILPAHLRGGGGHTGRAPLRHPLRGETLTKFVPSLTHTPHRRRAAPTKAGEQEEKKKNKKHNEKTQ